MSSLRMLRFRSRTHSKASRNIEAMLKRIALKLRGDRSVKAILTTEKFMPQTKLIPISIRSTTENLVPEVCELSAFTCSSPESHAFVVLNLSCIYYACFLRVYYGSFNSTFQFFHLKELFASKPRARTSLSLKYANTSW